MTELWKRRLRNLSAALLATTLACGGLAVVLFASGDLTAGQAACGAFAVLGLAFVATVCLLATAALKSDSTPQT